MCTRDGLKANMFIMAHMELGQQYLVLCGVYAATFSSALASLVGAPQVLASIAQDRIFDFPFINCFGVTHARPKVRSSFLLFAACLLFAHVFFISFVCSPQGLPPPQAVPLRQRALSEHGRTPHR